ncbi:hypothetical protein DFH06DRAFT_53284 [Mycena polygramma]|nr:hypothetical protein DFH06DRAFT_53284 [Mycena polygramma]
MVEAHTALQNQPREPNCTLERVILSLMWWSDSTHLASFGDAALWPLYLFFGNQSKWLRVKPRSNLCHHVAYFPKLPDSFHDFFKKLTGEDPSADILTHCRRDLMHAIWRLLLDDEFLHAWEHGIVIECEDGVFRRFHPRIFTYSADYPEKVLLATIRNLGKAPCPRCYLPKEDIPDLGMVRDEKKRETLARTDAHVQNGPITRIRNWIYQQGRKVKSTTFDSYLLARSWTPTSNAFSDRLSTFGFNPFKMLVVDFMHEFELGVFKAFFIHLLRILQAYGNGAIGTLNERFRLIPTFGRATIRLFTLNTSALKKMAAWNYQAILLCAIPVVEGLLPEPHNGLVLDVLFTLAEWHTLAKLKMHTDSTVGLLRSVNKELGRLLRKFKAKTCSQFATQELPAEEAARGRRESNKASKGKGKGRAKVKTTPKTKQYSLLTYKLHALGDYVASILWFGTTDSYSTQPTCQALLCSHEQEQSCAPNDAFRTTGDIPAAHRRPRATQRTALRENDGNTCFSGPQTEMKRTTTYVPFAESEALPYTAPEEHHHISGSHRFSLHLPTWLTQNRDDPAVDDFMPKLQEHLLSRLAHPEWTGDGNEFSPEERHKLSIKNRRIYRHKILRVNYTSYDVRRGQDCLNPRTHSDLMVLAPDGDTSHPFSYAQILGIFHADVVNTAPGADPNAQSMEFLWVRRYRLDSTWRAGFKKKRLHRLEFLPDTDSNAFGFLNPDEVIRGTHIIPAFARGKTTELLASGSAGRLPHNGLTDDEDWRYYYVNFFVDRDMYMRYRGGGVGHYSVEIPEEDDIPPAPDSDDEEDHEFPISIPLGDLPVPSVTPPQSPEIAPATLPDRPLSSLSHSSKSGSDSDSDSDDYDESELNKDLDGAGEDSEDDELGPEDGDGNLEEDEVVEGYIPL